MVDIAQAAQKSQSPPPPPPPLSGAGSPPSPDPSPMLKEEAILPKENPVVTPTVTDKSSEDIMNAVLNATAPATVQTTTTTTSQVVEPLQSTPPPTYEKPKKRSPVAAILLTMILLLAAIGIGGYYVSQQQQLAEIRSRATGPYGTNTPTPPPSCSGPLASCERTACCSGQNLVCQGVEGSRKCQQTGPGGSGDAFCKSDPNNPGLGCNRYRGHKCSNLTNNQCVQNGQTFTTWDQAVAYSQGCGQADVACNEGSKDGQLCGDFVIFNSDCGTSTTATPTRPPITNTPTRPPITNTPTNTPVPLTLTCEAIRVYSVGGTAGGQDITSAVRNGTRKLALGESIILATPKAGATKARFRIQGVTQFAENNPAISTATEYRLAIQIPTTITQTGGSFEAEVFIGGAWH